MPTYRMTAPAEAEACLGPVRRIQLILRHYLQDETLLDELDLALTEACSNVVRHAYPPGGPGPMELVLEVRPGREVVLEVADWGKGYTADHAACALPEPGSRGGRGFYIIAQCSDELAFF